jgi:hypothetical protein
MGNLKFRTLMLITSNWILIKTNFRFLIANPHKKNFSTYNRKKIFVYLIKLQEPNQNFKENF